MQLESHTSSTVTTETYCLLTDLGPVTYIEYLNDKGKVIDVTLRDDNGNDIDNATLLEEIQSFIDKVDDAVAQPKYDGWRGCLP